MAIKSLSELITLAKSKQKKMLVVATAEDKSVLAAVKDAMNQGLITPLLIGDKSKISDICGELGFSLTNTEIIDQPDSAMACRTAVMAIREKKAQILMKGFVATSVLLHAVLDKETGISDSPVLSHFTLSQIPTYHKLLSVTDAAMNISPDLNQKIEIVKNAVKIMNCLGYDKPKVAVVCPVETVNPKIESTIHAAILTMMNQRGQIKNCIIDGPLALDNSISKEAALHKGIKSEVAGDADILLTPDLDAGNILYKSINFLAGGLTAAIIIGAKVPFVLTSRADSEESKLMSIALAVALQ